jgi:5'-3' exoribonuclease 2
LISLYWYIQMLNSLSLTTSHTNTVDFLPHLPSLDIRDGALDYLFNVYRRILPGLGGYLTDHGGKVHLDRVDVILAEVGSIEDYVFEMKHANEQRDKARRQQMKQNGTNGGKLPSGGIGNAPTQENFQRMGRSARIMAENGSAASNKQGVNSDGDIKLQRGHVAKEELRKKLKGKPSSGEENAKAAEALKQQLLGTANPRDEEETAEDNKDDTTLKRKADEIASSEEVPVSSCNDDEEMFGDSDAESVVGDPDLDETEEETEEDRALMDEAHKNLKEKVKAVETAKLDDFAKNVKDNVRLHEPGWKVSL